MKKVGLCRYIFKMIRQQNSKDTTSTSEAKVEYFGVLKLDPTSEAAKPLREAALARAYQLRSFEIEHYWKRATYFWAYQVAIFAAFGLLKPDSPLKWGPIPLAIAGLGVLTAFANLLSAQGSKFWQANWEAHIDMLEDEFEGLLHKAVGTKDGKPSYSVSRLNVVLNGCFCVFWSLIFFYAIFQFCPPILPLRPIPPETASFMWILSIFVAVAIGLVLMFRQRSAFGERRIRWISRGRVDGGPIR